MGVQTAMIIDDDADLGQLMIAALEKRKIHTMVVHSLDEAAKYLTYLKPTVVFLDNSFPEGLGVNFIQEIKSADAEIKIIMMTADSDDWLEEKAKENGAVRFLKKPLNRDIIYSVLDDLNLKK
ncbi:MAG: response regulator [Chitinophagaceae bacterium]